MPKTGNIGSNCHLGTTVGLRGRTVQTEFMAKSNSTSAPFPFHSLFPTWKPFSLAVAFATTIGVFFGVNLLRTFLGQDAGNWKALWAVSLPFSMTFGLSLFALLKRSTRPWKRWSIWFAGSLLLFWSIRMDFLSSNDLVAIPYKIFAWLFFPCGTLYLGLYEWIRGHQNQQITENQDWVMVKVGLWGTGVMAIAMIMEILEQSITPLPALGLVFSLGFACWGDLRIVSRKQWLQQVQAGKVRGWSLEKSSEELSSLLLEGTSHPILLIQPPTNETLYLCRQLIPEQNQESYRTTPVVLEPKQVLAVVK
jgi:hypothetical protein